MKQFYLCPVCGYKGLEDPPYDKLGNSSFEICSCCGFQFGVDDDHVCSKEAMYKQYREKWLKNGSCLSLSIIQPDFKLVMVPSKFPC